MLCRKNILYNLKKTSALLWVTIIFTISCNFAKAQEEFIAPPSQLLTSFPFTILNGGIITVKARLDDYPDTLTFIFDTGSGGISLDSSTCIKMHILTELSDRTIRG